MPSVNRVFCPGNRTFVCLPRNLAVFPTLALLFAATTARAQLQAVPAVTDDVQVAFSLNTLTPGPAALVSPGGIAVAPDGTVYVTDSGVHGTANGRVVRITPAGQVSGTGTATITGAATVLGVTLNTPNAVVVDSLGNLYIADIVGHRVYKVTNPETSPSATTVTYGAATENPTALAVDSSNTLYIADATQNAVFVAGATTKLASGGTGPVGLAVDASGNVYFADKSNVIFKYTKSTASTSQLLNGFSFASAQLNVPIGMGFDPAGNLYVLDSGAGKVFEYNPAVVADNTQIPFSNITKSGSLALDAVGDLYLSSYAGNAVDELFYNNNPVNFGAFAGTASGKVTVNSYFNVGKSTVKFYQSVQGDSTGEFVAPATDPCLNTPAGTPTGVTAATQCNFQFSVNYSSATPGLRDGVFGLTDSSKEIFAVPAIGISRIGRLALYPGNQSSLTAPAGGFFEPQAVAVTGNGGTVFVADEGGNLAASPPTFTNGNVYQYAGGVGAPTKVGATFETWSSPTALALNPAGYLYVADYNGTITVVAPPWTSQGAALTFPAGATPTHPIALAFDPSGNLYIGDMGPLGVGATAQNPGYVIKVPGDGGPAVKLFYQVSGVPVVFPQALVTDTAGNLYIADGGDGSTDMGGLAVVPVNGTAPFLLPAGGYQPFGQSLNQPAGLSFDAAGDLYVLDGYNQRVLVFPITYTSGTPTVNNADITPLGQTSDQAGSSGITSTLITPTNLAVWPGGQKLTITDIGFQANGQGTTYPAQVLSLDSTNTTVNAPAGSPGSAMGVNVGNEIINFTAPTTVPATSDAFTLSVCGNNGTSVSTSVVSPCFPEITNNSASTTATENFNLNNAGVYSGSYIKATGTSQAPFAVLTAPGLTFSQTVTATLSNQGLNPLDIYNISVSGLATLTGGTCSTFTPLAGGTSCTILMTFNNGVSFTTGTVTVVDNSGGVIYPATATQSASTFLIFSFFSIGDVQGENVTPVASKVSIASSAKVTHSKTSKDAKKQSVQTK